MLTCKRTETLFFVYDNHTSKIVKWVSSNSKYTGELVSAVMKLVYQSQKWALSNPNIISKKGDKLQELTSTSNSNVLRLNWQNVPAPESQEDRSLVPPEGVHIAWELNGTRWTIRQGVW